MQGIYVPKEDLTKQIFRFCKNLGATSVGIVTQKTLSPVTSVTDLTSVLPGSRSAICFSVPRDQSKIDDFLGKKDALTHHHDGVHTNVTVNGISLVIATFLSQKGFTSIAVTANCEYKSEGVPPLSHRYLAVASGALDGLVFRAMSSRLRKVPA